MARSEERSGPEGDGVALAAVKERLLGYYGGRGEGGGREEGEGGGRQRTAIESRHNRFHLLRRHHPG